MCFDRMCSILESEENVFTFEDEQPVSDSVHQYTDVLRNDKAAIIIDNGMCTLPIGEKHILLGAHSLDHSRCHCMFCRSCDGGTQRQCMHIQVHNSCHQCSAHTFCFYVDIYNWIIIYLKH